MNRKNSHSYSSTNRSSLEAFQGLAAIYLSSAERLTALNLASARGLLDDTLTASMQRPSTGTDFGFTPSQVASVQPIFEKAVAYSRDAYGILLETQYQVIQALTSQFTGMNLNFMLPTDWTAPFEMFTKGLQEVSELTKKNASATAEATKSAVAETISKLSKAA